MIDTLATIVFSYGIIITNNVPKFWILALLIVMSYFMLKNVINNIKASLRYRIIFVLLSISLTVWYLTQCNNIDKWICIANFIELLTMYIESIANFMESIIIPLLCTTVIIYLLVILYYRHKDGIKKTQHND